MSRQRLIVLKFGGSVLRNEESLVRAVHEIQRWRREDYRVVAVVSALAGETEALLDHCEWFAEGSSDRAVAAVVAGGELRSASLLGLLLDRAGIPAAVLSPGAIGLTSEGPALDAVPQRLETRPLRDALARDEVAVVPGFVAQDRSGRTTLLGRGGSDLTALFLARRLGATRCRLVKDVHGLYEWDPATPGPAPGRYASVSWADALDTDGSIVQHKAVRFARSHGVSFELGSLNSVAPTLVGAVHTRLEPCSPSRPPLRVALLGLGTVGGGLLEHLRELPELFRVSHILVKDPRGRPEADGLRLTTDGSTAVEDVDVVVEALGGVSPAAELIECALANGAHVVTANKAAVASRGPSLAAAAEHNGLRFLHSAAVGGCTPLLERLTAHPEGIRSVRGVLNGTVNFLLEGLASGRELDELLTDARRRGLCERDATSDTTGQDAVDKLRVTARVLGWELDEDAVQCQALDEGARALALGAASRGRFLRQVSTLWIEAGVVRGKVALEALEPGDPLARTRAEGNAGVIERLNGTVEVVRGKGAGRWPTAESVMGDLLEIARGGSTEGVHGEVPAGDSREGIAHAV